MKSFCRKSRTHALPAGLRQIYSGPRPPPSLPKKEKVKEKNKTLAVQSQNGPGVLPSRLVPGLAQSRAKQTHWGHDEWGQLSPKSRLPSSLGLPGVPPSIRALPGEICAQLPLLFGTPGSGPRPAFPSKASFTPEILPSPPLPTPHAGPVPRAVREQASCRRGL